MFAFTLLALLVLTAALFALLRRVANVEEQLRRVESLLATRDLPATTTLAESAPKPPARIVSARIIPPPAPLEAEPAAVAPPEPRFSLETLIGKRLPIWIGGAALVFAGFFLVRYSIESGLLGPPARTILAALFAFALIGASEAARRLPAFRDDERVAQVLAGAGVASLYATLYLAASLYHLLTPGAAFAAVVAITALALAMSLRHGPPTAAIALAGGFLAPVVAGFDAAEMGPLLAYLALLIAALFGLAIRRNWGWLAVTASVAGFVWINVLILAFQASPAELSAVGGFAMLLAGGASAAFPATGLRSPWLRAAPLVAGFLQLVALAPALDFGALAWSFYLVLAAAALLLSWRDRLYLPAALAAAGLVLVLEALALLQPESGVTPIAATIAALLFALPGHLRAREGGTWAALALLGTAGPLLVAHATAPALLPDSLWGLLEVAAATAAAHLAWRLRDAEGGALTGATALAGLLAALGLAQFVPAAWLSVPLSLVLVGLGLWARRLGYVRLLELPAYPFVAALVAAMFPLGHFAELFAQSLAGEPLTFPLLPDVGTLLQALALPVIAAIALLADPRQYGRSRRFVATAAAIAAVLLVYTLAKQPLAIAELPRFVAFGLLERAVLTQICLAAGWLLMRRRQLPMLGKALFLLGLFRFLWFDLLLLNPAWEPQSVGAIPLANLALLHAGLVAAWLWTLPPQYRARPAAAAATLVAGLVAVRQAAHGNLLTGPIGTGENGGYSIVLLGLSLFWLWRGIAAEKRDLRVFGLALLTLVTGKVFLIDAAALDGVLRILSFLGLGLALIGIGWAYGRFLGKGSAPQA